MQIVLCRRKRSFSASVLRFFLMSGASHSALHDVERGEVYDASFLGGGVQKCPAAEFFAKYLVVRALDVELTPIAFEEARAWLADQLGKPYDWRAVFGLALRRAWQDADAWHCSEFTEAFRSLFGRARFRPDAWRITPRDQEITY